MLVATGNYQGFFQAIWQGGTIMAYVTEFAKRGLIRASLTIKIQPKHKNTTILTLPV